MDRLGGHRMCRDANNKCRKITWWAVTIRGGKTFSGEGCCKHYDDGDDEEFFLLRTESGENELFTCVLIEEIVAIQEVEPPS